MHIYIHTYIHTYTCSHKALALTVPLLTTGTMVLAILVLINVLLLLLRHGNKDSNEKQRDG